MAQYENPFGQFQLKRIPDSDKNLQAWNSADSYLLKALSEQMDSKALHKASILILNDDFGALTVSLARFSCDNLSDSLVSQQAAKDNIQSSCPQFMERVTFIKSTETLTRSYDLVVFKIPKSLAFLQDQMLNLRPYMHENTKVIGAIMAKNLHRSVIEVLNKYFSSVETSLAWKKARLIHLIPSVQTTVKTDSHIKLEISEFLLDDGRRISALSNVFSRNHLDIGARFFLQHFPGPSEIAAQSIIDLGCGNGVLSLKAALSFPDAQITAVDESYMAVESARMTIADNFDELSRFKFICANSLESFETEQVDLIICNPPFHQNHTVGDAIAWEMFKQSKRVLKDHGQLWIVGNRHLAYHLKLKKLFGNQLLVATNNKFVILKAIKN